MSNPVSSDPAGRRWSLAGRLSIAFAVSLVLIAALAAALSRLPQLDAWQVFLACLILGLPLGLWLLSRALRPVTEVVQALSDGVTSLRDNDFSIRLAVTRRDELGELVASYNQAVEVLRDERAALRQRELLLETALHRSPVATVLVDHGDRVIYANPEARRLFFGGTKLEGHRFTALVEGCPPELRAVLDGGDGNALGGDGLFTTGDDAEAETYHLSERRFLLNRLPHRLVLLRRLTGEIDRREARIWKRAIRIISHELNNSLAPVSSLVHSAGLAAERPEHRERLPRIFESIGERIAHLTDFLQGYARFARLPEPAKESTDWAPLLERVGELYAFRLEGPPPGEGYFDPGQMEQVLINLLKNAHEASQGDDNGEASVEVVVRLLPIPTGGTQLEVLDRGRGMEVDVLRNALLPFYSTKAGGVGVGLPLCREIIAEHGGRLAIRNREGGGVAVSCWLPD